MTWKLRMVPQNSSLARRTSVEACFTGPTVISLATDHRTSGFHDDCDDTDRVPEWLGDITDMPHCSVTRMMILIGYQNGWVTSLTCPIVQSFITVKLVYQGIKLYGLSRQVVFHYTENKYDCCNDWPRKMMKFKCFPHLIKYPSLHWNEVYNTWFWWVSARKT